MCAGGEDLFILIMKAHLMRVRVWPPTNPILFMSILVQNGKSVLFAHAKSSDWRTFMHSCTPLTKNNNYNAHLSEGLHFFVYTIGTISRLSVLFVMFPDFSYNP